MRVYTYTEARQSLARLLDEATAEGEVRIRRRDGRVFLVTPAPKRGSPFDVEGMDLGLTTEEIVKFVREGRERPEPSPGP